MRIAALYDIHANLPALDAVLEDVEQQGVDLIVVGGDIAWGPFPGATLDRLQALGDNATFLRGNADREVAQRVGTADGLDETTAEVTMWCADQLSAHQREWLISLPETRTYDVEGLGAVLFCHGSPRSDEECITHLTPDRRLREALRDVLQLVVMCGHTHMQFERAVDDIRVVNPGSVGMPYQGDSGAYWALLGPDVDLRRTDYDTVGAAEAMRRTICPHVEEVFIDALLRPPSADDAARQFEGA